MAGMFRKRGGGEPSEVDAGEVAPDEVPLPFDPPRRGAAAAQVRQGGAAQASLSAAGTDAEGDSPAEVALLREQLTRERADRSRALAEADRRLVEALAEQRAELEAEARERVAEAWQRAREAESALRQSTEELARERAEIDVELAATRRRLEEAQPELAAMAQPSIRSPRG